MRNASQMKSYYLQLSKAEYHIFTFPNAVCDAATRAHVRQACRVDRVSKVDEMHSMRAGGS